MRLLMAFLLSLTVNSSFAAGGFSEIAPPTTQADAFETYQPQNISTLKEVMRMGDKMPVRLRGHIIKNSGQPLHYIFEDETGTIKLEINDDVWMGQDVTPAIPVEIIGIIDIDPWSTEIKVKHLRVVVAQ